MNYRNGFSLVEVLIVAAVGSIIALGMMSLLSSFSKEFKAFDEKSSIQNLQIQLQGFLSNPEFCKCFVSNNGTNTLNYSATPKTWSAFPQVMYSSYNATSSCNNSTTELIHLNNKIGNSSLVPISMEIIDTVESSVGSGKFAARFNIEFKSEELVRARKGVSIPINFSVDMSASIPNNARPIKSCGVGVGMGAVASGLPMIVDGGATYRHGPALPSWRQGAQNLNCPPGQIMTGLIVNTSGTAQHHADGDGPIMQSLWIKCSALE